MATNNRGGARLGAGRKKKTEAVGLRRSETALNTPLADLALESINFEAADTCPAPNAYLSRPTKGMLGDNRGAEILKNIWQWLKVRDCEKLVNPENLQLWALQVAKYEQIVSLVDSQGYLYNKSGVPDINPYEELAEKALKRASALWAGIEVVIADRVKFYADRTGENKSPLDRLLNLSAASALNADGNAPYSEEE
ncbi:MAG: hypothetical protein LBS99_03765 [Clostridiales bacterium]|nr:hypothetical protein [Clostridiales bacterium]